jgi:hypothetical protein
MLRTDSLTFSLDYLSRYNDGLRGWTAAVLFPVLIRSFSVFHTVQTGPEAHPASYQTGTGGCSPGGKRPEREADHSLPSIAEVKNGWAYLHSSIYLRGIIARQLFDKHFSAATNIHATVEEL